MAHQAKVDRLATSSPLTVMGLRGVIDLYTEKFPDSPCLLVVSDNDYFPAKEILHYKNGGADRIRLEVAGWLPLGVWMLVGDKRCGIIYSGDVDGL